MSQKAVKKLAWTYVRSAAGDDDELGVETVDQRRPSMHLRPHRQYTPVIGLSRMRLTPSRVTPASKDHSWIGKIPGSGHWNGRTDGASMDESKSALKHESQEPGECSHQSPAITTEARIDGSISEELKADTDQEPRSESVAVPYTFSLGRHKSQRSQGHRKGNMKRRNQHTDTFTAEKIVQHKHMPTATDHLELVDCFVSLGQALEQVPQHVHKATRQEQHGVAMERGKSNKGSTGRKSHPAKGMPFYSRTSRKNLSSSSRGLLRAPMLLRPNRKYTSVFHKSCACERNARHATEVLDDGKHTQCNRKASQGVDASTHQPTNPDIIHDSQQTQAISDASSVSLSSAIESKFKSQPSSLETEQLSPKTGQASAFIQARPKSRSQECIQPKIKEGFVGPPKATGDVLDSKKRYSQRENGPKRKGCTKGMGKIQSGDLSVLKEINDAISYQFLPTGEDTGALPVLRKTRSVSNLRWSKTTEGFVSKRVMMLRPYTNYSSLAGLPKTHIMECKHWLLSQGNSSPCSDEHPSNEKQSSEKRKGLPALTLEVVEKSHRHDTAAASPSRKSGSLGSTDEARGHALSQQSPKPLGKPGLDSGSGLIASKSPPCPDGGKHDQQCLSTAGMQREDGAKGTTSSPNDSSEKACPVREAMTYAVLCYAPKILMMLRPYPSCRPMVRTVSSHRTTHMLLSALRKRPKARVLNGAHELQMPASDHPPNENAAEETGVPLTSGDSADLPRVCPGCGDIPPQAMQGEDIQAPDAYSSETELEETQSIQNPESSAEETDVSMVDEELMEHPRELACSPNEKADVCIDEGESLQRTLPFTAVKTTVPKSKVPQKRKKSNGNITELDERGDFTQQVDVCSSLSVPLVVDKPPAVADSLRDVGTRSYGSCGFVPESLTSDPPDGNHHGLPNVVSSAHTQAQQKVGLREGPKRSQLKQDLPRSGDRDAPSHPHPIPSKRPKKSTSFQPMQRQRRRCRSVFARDVSRSGHRPAKISPKTEAPCPKEPVGPSGGNTEQQPLPSCPSDDYHAEGGENQDVLAEQKRLRRVCLEVHAEDLSALLDKPSQLAGLTANESPIDRIHSVDSVNRTPVISLEENNNQCKMPSEETSVAEDTCLYSCLTLPESEISAKDDITKPKAEPEDLVFTDIRHDQSNLADSKRSGNDRPVSTKVHKTKYRRQGSGITGGRPIKACQHTAMNLRKKDKHFLFSQLGFKKAKQKDRPFILNTESVEEPHHSIGSLPKKGQTSFLGQGISQLGIKNQSGRGRKWIGQAKEDSLKSSRMRKSKGSSQIVSESDRGMKQNPATTLDGVLDAQKRGRPKQNAEEVALELPDKSHQDTPTKCPSHEGQAQQKSSRKGNKAVIQELPLTVAAEAVPRRTGRTPKRLLHAEDLPLQQLATNNHQVQHGSRSTTSNSRKQQQQTVQRSKRALLQKLSRTTRSDGAPKRRGKPKKRKWKSKELPLIAATESQVQSKERRIEDEHYPIQDSVEKGDNRAASQVPSPVTVPDAVVPRKKGRPKKGKRVHWRHLRTQRGRGRRAPASSSHPKLVFSKRIRQLIPGYTSPDEEEFTLEEFCSLATLEEAVERAACEAWCRETVSHGLAAKCTVSQSNKGSSSSNKKSRAKRSSRSPEGSYWDCSVCTYRNKAEAFKCAMCDVRKGTSTRKPRLNAQLVAQQQAQQNLSPLIHVKPVKTTTPRGPAQRKAGASKKPRPRLKNVDRSTAISTEVIVNNVPVIITEFKEKSHTRPTVDSDEASTDRTNGNVNGL